MREVSEAVVILLLAWALGSIVNELRTADYLSSLLGSWLPSSLLPAVALVISMTISFGIGSAWGSMGILIPLVAPLAWQLSHRDLTTLTVRRGWLPASRNESNMSSVESVTTCGPCALRAP